MRQRPHYAAQSFVLNSNWAASYAIPLSVVDVIKLYNQTHIHKGETRATDSQTQYAYRVDINQSRHIETADPRTRSDRTVQTTPVHAQCSHPSPPLPLPSPPPALATRTRRLLTVSLTGR